MSDKNEMPYEYAVEELYINRDGRQLYGVVYIPQNAREEKMPAVIFSHGFSKTDTQRAMNWILEYLQKQKIKFYQSFRRNLL